MKPQRGRGVEVEKASVFSAGLGALCLISMRIERHSPYPPLGMERKEEQRL